MHHHSDLTDDPLRICSLSYRGLASRREMWVMFALLIGVQLVSSALPNGYGEPLVALFYILFAFPLLVRRARQMGAAWYGIVVIVSPIILIPLANVFILSFDCSKAELIYFMLGIMACILLLLAPLHVWGGALAGRKNELMRAAIAGDMARARLLVEEHPQQLLQKSEKGYTAREYAERRRHHELANWLREQEETALSRQV